MQDRPGFKMHSSAHRLTMRLRDEIVSLWHTFTTRCTRQQLCPFPMSNEPACKPLQSRAPLCGTTKLSLVKADGITPNASCAWYYHALGKGSRCAPPLHPPGLWLRSGHEPSLRASRTCGRSITTMSWRPTLRGLDARHFMETISSRPGREHFIAALSLEPSHRPRSLRPPLEP